MALAAAGFAQVAPRQVAFAGNAACSGAASDYQYASQSFFDPTHPHFVNDPQLTLNDLFAPPSTLNRDYDAIDEVCAKATGISLPGLPGSWAKILIITGAANPGSQSGDHFEVCARPVSSTGVWANEVQVGTNIAGIPIFDGPYPPDSGWRGCSYATFGVTNDYGWAWRSPNDESVVQYSESGRQFPAASWGGNVVTIYMPDFIQWQAPGGSLVTELVGLGGHATEMTAQAFAAPPAGLPTPVCLEGCTPTLAEPGELVAWAPGKIQTILPGGTPHWAGIDLGLVPPRPGVTAPGCPVVGPAICALVPSFGLPLPHDCNDLPTIAPPAGGTAQDHLIRCFDLGLEAIYPPIAGVPQVHY